MEYVEGEPIDRHAARLPVRDRLNLFVRVCDAVAYAHRRLIVHRDLKPSNILVDAAGQPKLLDFGIAKLLDDTGDPTVTLERVLTPSFASPEQFRGAAHTTATDVYSLGAVLFTLLTGRVPYEGTARPDLFSDSASPAEIPAATKLNPELPSDIDYILRRALRRDPDDRYASVEAFAADVRALLDGRPVEARSADAWYRTRKFLLRYRVRVGASAIVIISLVAGLSIANRERVIAQKRFEQVRQIANEFIGLDAEIRELPGSTKVRNHIVSESLRYLAGLSGEARGDMDLALDIARAYVQIARVQGVPASVGNLGQLGQAEDSLKKADRFVDSVLAANPNQPSALLASAEIAHDWMAVVDYQDRRAEALVHARKASQQLDRFLSLGAPPSTDIDTATHIYSNIATAYSNSSQLDQAITFSRRAVDVSRGVPEAAGRRAAALGVLCASLRRAGDLDGALAAVRESRTLLEDIAKGGGVRQQVNLINALTREGLLLGDDTGVSLNEPAEALMVFGTAGALAEALADRDRDDYRSRRLIATIGQAMGGILRHTDPRKAMNVYDHALSRLREGTRNARAQRDEIYLLSGSSYTARWLGQEPEAKRRIDEAFRILRETKQYPGPVEPWSEPHLALKARADDYAETDDLGKAIATYQALLAGIMEFHPRPQTDLRDAAVIADTWFALGAVLRRSGRPNDASSLDQQRADLWRSWQQRTPNNSFVLRQIQALPAR
jgi:tetratricopeptide (TPR) repeat protein